LDGAIAISVGAADGRYSSARLDLSYDFDLYPNMLELRLEVGEVILEEIHRSDLIRKC